MAKFWTPKTEKMTVAASMALTGYAGLSVAFPTLPQLPAFLTNTVVGSLSILTAAAGMTLYGVFVLLTKY